MGAGDGVVGQADRNGQEVGMHGKEWIGFEDWVIRNDYPTEKTEHIAQRLGRTVAAVETRASVLRVFKTREFNENNQLVLEM